MKQRERHTGDVAMNASGQHQLLDNSVGPFAAEEKTVECLGHTFESDEARRAYFLEQLRERLTDPEFRKTPGFPIGTDEDILRLSDPPYYTACPNPFLADFVQAYGQPYDPEEVYERDPFAVDTSVGKSDALFKAHGYHTKVPHLAIVPSILHYTRPGDLVLDGFCGSGMTGVAAQWCGTAPPDYRRQLELAWKQDGRDAPEWGARRTILGDLGPAATFITAGYNLPFDVEAFARAARRILDEVEAELGWMYETLHTDGSTKGRINYTVWSEVFTCPECSGEVNFIEEALDPETKRTAAAFPCPHCKAELTKDNLERSFESLIDPATKDVWRRVRLRPALINYVAAGKTHEKVPDNQDLEQLSRIATLPLPPEVPTNRLPIEAMYHGSRIAPKGFTHVHHFFLPRAAQALAALWRKATAEQDVHLRNALLFFVEQALWTSSVLNRFRPTGYSQVNQYLAGVYYIPSQISEPSPWYVLNGKASRLADAFLQRVAPAGQVAVTTGDCGAMLLPNEVIDYIFTDPPFGENIYYADLNFLVESWHRVLTNSDNEAIVDQAKKKGTHEYQELMRRCFAEYHRVLKPGRWMTVVFSNSSNAIWRAIQEAIGIAGFVVADVRTLDKQQGSYRQVTSSAVKQDLVISAYKPTTALTDRFRLGTTTPEDAWAFVTEHLRHVPLLGGKGHQTAVIAARTPQILYDRMVAFHVQRSLAVPMSTTEFMAGLKQRYPERDGMYLLSDQVAEYDRKRITTTEIKQLSLIVSDEASAIQWVRQQLTNKPQSFQDLQPVFMRELQGWATHERTIELKEMLEQNFLRYDGRGPVSSQIHSYLSTNFKDLRNREKDDPVLMEKARDRWYVPDPSKQADLDKLRERFLLNEFAEYVGSTQRKLKQFRTEAIRAGFKAAYDSGDYKIIITAAAKLPETVLQEDEKLLMYFDVASMRLGEA
jgi:DNA methylase